MYLLCADCCIDGCFGALDQMINDVVFFGAESHMVNVHILLHLCWGQLAPAQFINIIILL